MLHAMSNFDPDDDMWKNETLMLKHLFLDTLKHVSSGLYYTFF